MRKRRKVLAFVLIMALFCTGILSGCGEKKETTSGVIDKIVYDGGYPVKTDKTLTYYARTGTILAEVATDMNDTEYAKELIKRTGINIEFVHPPVGQEAEDFNLMLASNEFPDIIETNWFFNNQGPAALVEDGVILPLNDVIEKAAPNLKAIFDRMDENTLKQYRANGNLYCFPAIGEADIGKSYFGVMVRQDLLDKAGLEIPETIDDWEEMLTAFKDEVDYPMQMRLVPSYIEASSDLFVGAFGVSAGYYVDDGKIKYGPQEPGYKKWVEKMRDWYKKGLINKDFASVGAKAISANFLNAQVGAAIGSNGSDFGTWIPILAESHPDVELVPVPYPSLKEGEPVEFAQKDVFFGGYGAAISTQCQDVELAARLLDWLYSKEGGLLTTIGIEGVTYEKTGENSYKYLPKVTDSQKLSGETMTQVLAKYTRNVEYGIGYQFKEAMDCHMAGFYRNPINLAAARLWGTTKAELHKIPRLTFSSEDSDKMSALKTDITTYVDENIVGIINGTYSMDRYDEFLKGLKDLQVDTVIDIYQRAYDEFMKN